MLHASSKRNSSWLVRYCDDDFELGPFSSTIFIPHPLFHLLPLTHDLHISFSSLQMFHRKSSVDDIVPQFKKLPDDLVCLATNGIVVHDIGCESLTSLDLLRGLTRVIIVDIHLELVPSVNAPSPSSPIRTYIFLIHSCVYRNLILAELLFVEQCWPVRVCGDPIGNVLDLAKLAVVLKHPAENLYRVSHS